MLTPLNKLAKFVDAVTVWISLTMLAALAIVINVQVFFRYVLRSPLSWTMELAGYLLAYAVMFGAGVAFHRRKFAYVEFVVNGLPRAAKLLLETVGTALILVFVSVGFWMSRELIAQAALTKIVSPALGWPMSLIYTGFQAAFGLQAFFALVVLTNLVADLIGSTRSHGPGRGAVRC